VSTTRCPKAMHAADAAAAAAAAADGASSASSASSTNFSSGISVEIIIIMHESRCLRVVEEEAAAVSVDDGVLPSYLETCTRSLRVGTPSCGDDLPRSRDIGEPKPKPETPKARKRTVCL